MAALQQCIDTKLAEWGVDPKAFAALSPPPTDIEGYSWLSYKDYPTDALDANRSGNVVARLNVDVTGKVTGCAVVVSSGWGSLDKVTCKKALEKGRFNPAIGADGHPTAAVRVENAIFKVWP
jgi:TonB family protein